MIDNPSDPLQLRRGRNNLAQVMASEIDIGPFFEQASIKGNAAAKGFCTIFHYAMMQGSRVGNHDLHQPTALIKRDDPIVASLLALGAEFEAMAVASANP